MAQHKAWCTAAFNHCQRSALLLLKATSIVYEEGIPHIPRIQLEGTVAL